MSTLKNHLNHVNFLYGEGGIAKMFDHLRENMLFDIMNGTDTSSWLEKVEFEDHPDNFEHGVRYRAAATSEIEGALQKVSNVIDTSSAGYYDMGCGKGKTLCIAGLKHDFNTVKGIDYYQPFLDLAQDNLEACKLDKVELKYGDMTEFKDFEDTSVVFFYNPADAEIINKVRQNLEECARRAIVVYNKPLHEDVFEGWDVVDRKTDADPDHNTTILSYGL